MRKIPILLVVAILFSSCSARLGMFTAISTKNINLAVKKSDGKKVKGKSVKFLGMGATIEEAIDDALEQAGLDADLLVDVVIKEVNYFFAAGYTVEGIALSSQAKKSELGSEEAFKKWCIENHVILKETQK